MTHPERTTTRQIRTTHPFGYRSGEWAALVKPVHHSQTDRGCYLVRFEDGASDWWVIDDPSAGYEFREAQ